MIAAVDDGDEDDDDARHGGDDAKEEAEKNDEDYDANSCKAHLDDADNDVMWEFPKIGDTNIVPYIASLLITRPPQYGTLIFANSHVRSSEPLDSLLGRHRNCKKL